jgi:prevent-host-death family protein
MDTIAISDLRTNLPSLINQVSEGLKRLIITVSGKPKAVMMSIEEMESLEETAEILAIPSILKTLKRSREQARKKQGITLEELAKKYRL